MRRLITATLTALMLMTTSATVFLESTAEPAAAAGATVARFVGPHEVPGCRFRYYDAHPSFSKLEVHHTIRCAVHRWSVPGGFDAALCVARRESGLNWDADNPFSSASGVYQFLDSTWSSQRSHRAELFHDQQMSPSVWNARSNVLTAIRSIHGQGWGPWGGQPNC